MPIVDYPTYCKMLDLAYKNKYAYPAINVDSIETANAVLQGLAVSNSDGIIQISKNGGEHASGSVNDGALGAISLANHIHTMADRYNIYIALHTDHCKVEDLQSFVYPLISETQTRRLKGEKNLFNSHMFDGSNLALDENLRITKDVLKLCAKDEIILEMETLYTSIEDMIKVYEYLKDIPNSKYMFTTKFSCIEGSLTHTKEILKPSLLQQVQQALKDRFGNGHNFYFVLDSDCFLDNKQISEALQYGIIKVIVDNITVYNKDMSQQVVKLCKKLNSAGKSLFNR